MLCGAIETVTIVFKSGGMGFAPEKVVIGSAEIAIGLVGARELEGEKSALLS
jgi:hypothetical protein